MPPIHGRNAKVFLDDSKGVLVDITRYVTDISLPQEPEQLETTTLGQQEKSYAPGFIGASASISFRYDPADDAIHDILAPALGAAGAAATRTLQFGPEGNATGKRRYVAELVFLGYDVTTGASDIVGGTANARVDGAVTRDTF